MDEKNRLYERFKLQWMIDHGYTLADLIDTLQEMCEEMDDAKNSDLQSIFTQWEIECGFNSEIWPCFEEFLDSDYEEFVRTIR